VAESNAQTVPTPRARSSRAKRRSTLLAAALLASLCLPAVFVVSRRVFAVTVTPQLFTLKADSSSQDYSRFSHSSPSAHAALTARSNCSSCHRRSDDSPEPRFPVHKDCLGCHLAQFTAPVSASNVNPICTVCHNQDDLNASNTRTKKFPALRSFTAEFDHAQHVQGSEQARPAEGCAACHTPIQRGVAQSIPAGLSAHQTCYRCHSPGRQASAFSSCGSCHALGAYSPTPTAARAYRVRFSHADHGPRQRLTCASCHVVMGRGLPQRRQVSSILPSQHFASPRAQSCMTCHNGRRAFGDTDTRDCRRCHSGPGFRMRG
jgi:c(7)-type cytochrome triheme protein